MIHTYRQTVYFNDGCRQTTTERAYGRTAYEVMDDVTRNARAAVTRHERAHGLPHGLFMAEAEGYDAFVNTREARLNAVAKELRDYLNRTGEMSDELFAEAMMRHGFDGCSYAEAERVRREVFRGRY